MRLSSLVFRRFWRGATAMLCPDSERARRAYFFIFPWLRRRAVQNPRREHVVVCGTREGVRGCEECCSGLVAVVLCRCGSGRVRVGPEFGGWGGQRLCGGWDGRRA